MKRVLAISIVLVLLLAGVGTVSALNLVQNPGFENHPSFSGGYKTLIVGSADLSPWIITSGSIDLIGSYWTANSSPNSIDLAGLYQEGTIIQNIDTVSTETYKLSFAMAGNPDAGPYPKRVSVYWDGAEVVGSPFEFNSNGKSHTNMGWTSHSVSNLEGSSGDTTELKFVDVTGEGTAWGVALDDVVVEKEENNVPVPEFPSIALPAALVVGLIGAVLFIRKSKDN